MTALVRDGENELLITLGDGWYRSTSGVDGDRDLFGSELAVLFQLEVNGKAVCVSDDDMEATQCVSFYLDRGEMRKKYYFRLCKNNTIILL